MINGAIDPSFRDIQQYDKINSYLSSTNLKTIKNVYFKNKNFKIKKKIRFN